MNVQFGLKPYQEIYRQPGLTWNPAQARLGSGIELLERAHILQSDAGYRGVLANPAYALLSNVKGRVPFHTPFTEHVLRLTNEADRLALISALGGFARAKENPALLENAFNAVADIYFYVARPEGKLSNNLLRGACLNALEGALQDTEISGNTRKLLQNQLRYKLSMLNTIKLKMPSTVSAKAMNSAERQMANLLTIKLDTVPLEKAGWYETFRLKRAVVSSKPEKLNELSANGKLGRVIPDWQRLTGPNNTQHSDQDFTLDVHSLKAVQYTKASPYFQVLSRQDQKLVATAALLHDIGKHAGPCQFGPIIPVDKTHPLKSEDVAKRVLPRLGYSAADAALIGKLIRYHQMIGSMMTQTLGKPIEESRPKEDALNLVAGKLGDRRTLNMLKALTEGDISAVKQDRGWFTPEIQGKLALFSQLISEKLA